MRGQQEIIGMVIIVIMISIGFYFLQSLLLTVTRIKVFLFVKDYLTVL